MSETNEKWSNLEETAEYLGVTKDTIRSWIKKSDYKTGVKKMMKDWKEISMKKYTREQRKQVK